MATTDEILEIVIDPMARLFGRPYGCRTDEEVAAAKAEYVSALCGFRADALREAWEEVRSSWTKTTWPQIAVLRKAAVEAAGVQSKAETHTANPERRKEAAIRYVQDGTAPPPGLHLPLKGLIAGRVAALEDYGLPKGDRATIPHSRAQKVAERALAAEAEGKVT